MTQTSKMNLCPASCSGLFDKQKEALISGKENAAVGFFPTTLKMRDGSKLHNLTTGNATCILRRIVSNASTRIILRNYELKENTIRP
jgi:hypothetical protein